MLVTHVTDTTMDVVWGATSHATPFTLTASGASWQYEGTLLLGSRRKESAMCDDRSDLGAATFEFTDQGADGTTELVIQGQVENLRCSDDTTSSQGLEITLTGVADTRVPRAVVPSDGFEPVHGVVVALDKPLDASATAALVPTDGAAPVALEPGLENGYVVRFSTDVVLAPGSSYALEVAGQDFAGIGGVPAAQVFPIPDFGVLAADGFESGATDGISGGLVVETFGVPALAGVRMLRVEPGTPTLLHLDRSAGESRLVMDLRLVDECGYGFPGSFDIAVGVVGTREVERPVTALGDSTTTATVEGSSVTVGRLQTLTVPLSEPTGDVLVYMRGQSAFGVFGNCRKMSALVDDVRLE